MDSVDCEKLVSLLNDLISMMHDNEEDELAYAVTEAYDLASPAIRKVREISSE
tara:strand:+ start:869 stop:1027 length:159 start_codon:yes stop_codon:yes gene_type:complete